MVAIILYLHREENMSNFEGFIGSSMRAYKLSAIIIASVRTGIFDAIEASSGNPEGIAAHTGIRVDRLNVILDVLNAAKLVRWRSKKVSLASSAKRYLCRSSEDYCGDIALYHYYCAPAWFSLSDVLLGKKNALRIDMLFASKDFLRVYMNALRRITDDIVSCILNVLPTPQNHGLLVDMGCGPASFPVAFIKQNQSWRAKIFDILPVRDDIRQTLLQQGVSASQIRFRQADVLANPNLLPHDADLVYLGHILHEYPDYQARKLVELGYKTLRKGGTLCVLDFDHQRGGTTGLPEAMFHASVLLFCGRAVRARGSQELCKLFTGIGFGRVRVEKLPHRVSYPMIVLLAKKEE